MLDRRELHIAERNPRGREWLTLCLLHSSVVPPSRLARTSTTSSVTASKCLYPHSPKYTGNLKRKHY